MDKEALALNNVLFHLIASYKQDKTNGQKYGLKEIMKLYRERELRIISQILLDDELSSFDEIKEYYYEELNMEREEVGDIAIYPSNMYYCGDDGGFMEIRMIKGKKVEDNDTEGVLLENGYGKTIISKVGGNV